jgi:DNA-binding transcriptional LysR family regulator
VGYLPDSNLIARRIAPVYGRFVASPDYIQKHGAPDTPEDLARHEAVMQGTETWRLTVKGSVVPVAVHGRFKADNGEALLSAALAGLGIAMLPDFMINPHVVSGALVPVLKAFPPPEAGVYVVRPPGAFPQRKVRALIEILLEKLNPAGVT